MDAAKRAEMTNEATRQLADILGTSEKKLANKNGLSFEVIGTGKNYDYLAKLTVI